MANAHESHHPHPNYLAVFGTLILLTAVSFLTVSRIWLDRWSPEAGHNLVMIVAVIKALLVAIYFMHLKYDWFKVYMFVVPALILGAVLMTTLLPDMTFAPTRIRYEVPTVAGDH